MHSLLALFEINLTPSPVFHWSEAEPRSIRWQAGGKVTERCIQQIRPDNH
jgi:hypothetical protein